MKREPVCEPSDQAIVCDMRIDAYRILKVTLLSIFLLTTLGIFSSFVLTVLGMTRLSLLLDGFMLTSEANLPTLFAVGQLLFCSMILFLISVQQARLGKKWKWHWRLLAVSFFLLAFDEAAMVHERVTPRLHLTGFLHYSWVVPAFVVIIIFGLFYLRFVLDLPQPFMQLFALSGAIYVGGALGIELLEGAHSYFYGIETFGYHLIAIAQEVLEMIALALFAYALVRFLARRQEPLCLRVRAS